jgi:hypothetical protein
MKKIWTIGMMLLLMSSCVKHADIYLKLSEEDAAAIPYREGQTVKFLNQDGDTVTYEVTRDEIYPYNGEQYINAIHGGDVMHPAPHSTECYARTVILYEQSYTNHMCFTVKPGKEFSFYFISNEGELNLDMYLPSVSSCTINGIDYEHVHHEILYSHFTGELLYDWYYNEEFGLLYFEKGNFSLTRIP